ncbi:MAG: hydrolase TatD [Candidatus Zixiibacteriota bacterium]|nr:MAG: hydrolase TatD [candidate division Zixibacteria bacterium]
MMIDSHCHLDFKDFDKNRAEIINNALVAGVHTMVNIGADLQTSINSVKLAEQYDFIYATVGVHPHDAKTFNPEVEEQLRRMIEHKKVVAVGEIGLDYYRDLSPRNIQEKVFRRQLEIAVEKDLPVVIHTRESFRDAVDIVSDYAGDLPGGIFHCFPGTVDDAYKVIDLGFHISVGGVITFPGAKMATVAAEAPLNRIAIETDSPYLTPMPYRGKTNQPAYVKYVCDKIAELRGMPAEEVEKITDRNSQRVYRLVDVFGG